jgi:hypothetical protein
MPQSPDVLERFVEVLVQVITATRPEYLTGPFTVAEIYQDLAPYRTHRDLIGVDMNGDYEEALFRMLAGEGDHLVLDSEVVRQELQRELASSNPNTALFREFAAADVRIHPSRVHLALKVSESDATDRGAAGTTPDVMELELGGTAEADTEMEVADEVAREPEVPEGAPGSGAAPLQHDFETGLAVDSGNEVTVEKEVPSETEEAELQDDVETEVAGEWEKEVAPDIVGSTLADEAPVGEAAVSDAPVDETPVSEALVSDAPASEPPSETPEAPSVVSGGGPAEPEDDPVGVGLFEPALSESGGSGEGGVVGHIETVGAPPLASVDEAQPNEAVSQGVGKNRVLAVCHWCREELPARDSVHFCPFCGSDLRPSPCRGCGAAMEARWQFCISCGTDVRG